MFYHTKFHECSYKYKGLSIANIQDNRYNVIMLRYIKYTQIQILKYYVQYLIYNMQTISKNVHF
jgi:hypothetical protein